jgi:hypothetical protein
VQTVRSAGSSDERDGVALIVDWDDTLFPSTWLKANLHKDVATLRSHPAVKAHYRKVVEFLSTATRYGHVFIVTAAKSGFVQKSCGILFPDLFTKIQELGVPILYSRPEGQETPVEEDKAMMFAMALGHVRPIREPLARFYHSDLMPMWSNGKLISADWKQVFSIGDAVEDLTALKSATGGHPAAKKLVKFKDDPGLTELTRELAVLTTHLPELVAIDRSVMLDINFPLHEQMYPECERFNDLGLTFTHPNPQWDKEQKKFSVPSKCSSSSTMAESNDRFSDVGSIDGSQFFGQSPSRTEFWTDTPKRHSKRDPFAVPLFAPDENP